MSRDRVAFVLAGVMVLYSVSNVVRALIDPVAFADNFGTPLDTETDRDFVDVYAVRTAFIALFGVVLIWRRDRALLMWFTGLAALMPVGDLVLVSNAGAPAGTIARHIAALVVLAALSAMFRSTSHAGHSRSGAGRNAVNAER